MDEEGLDGDRTADHLRAGSAMGDPSTAIPTPAGWAAPELWARFERWRLAEAPDLAPQLHAGARLEDLAAFEEERSVTLPEEFKAVWAIHDGQPWTDRDCLFPNGWMMLPLADSPSHDNLLLGSQDSDGQEDEMAYLEFFEVGDQTIKPVWSSPWWVGFAYADDGSYYCVDLDPGPNGNWGQVIVVYYDESEPKRLAPSFAIWFQRFITDLEEGNIYWDDDQFMLVED